MNDNLKFRGKSLENNQWVFGFYANIQDKEHYILQPCALGLFYCLVKPETVSQFIGLKDKNRVEIYEGDIHKFIYCPKTLNETIVGIISRDEWNTAVIADGKALYHIENVIKGTIEGNIWDSPGLMQKVS